MVRVIVAASERSDGGPRVVLASDRSARLMAELRQMAELELVRVGTHPVAADAADALTRVTPEEDAVLAV